MQGRPFPPPLRWVGGRYELAAVGRVSRSGSVVFFLPRVLVYGVLCGRELVCSSHYVWMDPLWFLVSVVHVVLPEK